MYSKDVGALSIFIEETSDYRIPSAFIYPLLAAFRSLMRKNGKEYTWKYDPIGFFQEIKGELAVAICEQAMEMRNPTKLGKNAGTWKLCYFLIESEMRNRK